MPAAPPAAPPRPAWLPLVAAALVVPTVLAGLTVLWPRPRIEAELTAGAAQALAAAGIDTAGPDAGAVVFQGRDAVLSGFTGSDAPRALEVVAGVEGVREARPAGGGTGSGTGGTGSGTGGTGGTDPVPLPVPQDAELDPAARAALQAGIDAVVTATPLTFRPDSPELTAGGARAVARITELVAAAPGARVQVDGFVATGPGSGVRSALELSEERARTVRDALVAGGVPADRVTTVGRGEGDVPAADAAGRRAAVTVVGEGS